jgi:gamma-glutamyltranspeptidase
VPAVAISRDVITASRALPPNPAAGASSRLISKTYAASLRAGIGDRATPSADIHAGKPPDVEGRNTTHFSVIDKDGNAVSNTYTLNFSYGLGLVAGGAGVMLNNELDDFTASRARPTPSAARSRRSPSRSCCAPASRWCW